MIAAAKAANRKLMIAYRCHYEPLNLEAMRRVRSGSLGKPRLVITKMVRQSDRPTHPTPGGWTCGSPAAGRSPTWASMGSTGRATS